MWLAVYTETKNALGIRCYYVLWMLFRARELQMNTYLRGFPLPLLQAEIVQRQTGFQVRIVFYGDVYKDHRFRVSRDE